MTPHLQVHGIGTISRWEFGEEARAAGARHIVYLRGLGEPGPTLSTHLCSHHETGEVLRESGVPVLGFRSSIVIGCGSTSFEMIRVLVERLPVMVTPGWVSAPTQPIGIDDLTENTNGTSCFLFPGRVGSGRSFDIPRGSPARHDRPHLPQEASTLNPGTVP